MASQRASTKSPRRLKRIQEREEAILDAALQLFSRFGLHGTTLDQIAESADVSRPNLFYYFKSKEEIYQGVLKRLLQDWLTPLEALNAEGDPVETLKSYIRAKVEFSRKNPEASRLFCLEIVQGAPLVRQHLRTSLKSLVDEKAELIKIWIKRGKLAPVDPYHLIFSIWATTQHYADFAAQIDAVVGKRLTQKAFFEATVENLQKLLLDGLRPRNTGTD
ncbi:HTH-type transcriptional regulator RutR [Bradyrhizobium sp. BR 10289]|uniref:HTH-type transcriptional regulator RutR n=1 Tax=Bradyrhizobium sp. BR 10289 TaxID=2749993 RepID=UPI001C64B402|nr:HTH-type transcriptional regulator RutR [Bradyrhizobium sp. BR 10289]MBW7970253.1 HTH-type transcriptional regulator RutR [Bradyrhizobium sp. BR 10289]